MQEIEDKHLLCMHIARECNELYNWNLTSEELDAFVDKVFLVIEEVIIEKEKDQKKGLVEKKILLDEKTLQSIVLNFRLCTHIAQDLNKVYNWYLTSEELNAFINEVLPIIVKVILRAERGKKKDEGKNKEVIDGKTLQKILFNYRKYSSTIHVLLDSSDPERDRFTKEWIDYIVKIARKYYQQTGYNLRVSFEDIAQDAYLDLIDSLPKYCYLCNLETWVYNVTKNRYFREWNMNQHEPQEGPIEPSEDDPNGNVKQYSSQDDPVKEAERKETQSEVRKVVEECVHDLEVKFSTLHKFINSHPGELNDLIQSLIDTIGDKGKQVELVEKYGFSAPTMSRLIEQLKEKLSVSVQFTDIYNASKK